MSGPNSVGKTRLSIEATRYFASVTLFVKDAAAVRQAGLATLSASNRPVDIVAEDPPLELVEPLAKQAVSAPHLLKLIITIPSPANAPVVRLNPDERVKETSVKPVPKHIAEEIVKAVNSGIDNNVRDWIIQQAGGIPGVLVAAADNRVVPAKTRLVSTLETGPMLLVQLAPSFRSSWAPPPSHV